MRAKKRKKKNKKFFTTDPIGNRFHVSNADFSTHENVLNYWRNPCSKNAPELFYKTVERSYFLYTYFFDLYCEDEYSILELGCSCCRNLNYLYQHGFKNLSGIDINQDAIDYASIFYTEMMKQVYDIPKIYCAPVEDRLKEFDNNEFDVVFTFATLQHIHINMLNYVCQEMQRIAKLYICIVEDVKNKKRNYKKLFNNFKFLGKVPAHKHININAKYEMFMFEKK